jgi:hypothetical protein
LVIPTTANFVAQYANRSRTATTPPTDARFTIAPARRSIMPGSTAWVMNMTPLTLTASSRSRSCSVVVSTVPTWPTPALFTSTSTRPWSAVIRPAAAWHGRRA